MQIIPPQMLTQLQALHSTIEPNEGPIDFQAKIPATHAFRMGRQNPHPNFEKFVNPSSKYLMFY